MSKRIGLIEGLLRGWEKPQVTSTWKSVDVAMNAQASEVERLASGLAVGDRRGREAVQQAAEPAVQRRQPVADVVARPHPVRHPSSRHPHH